MITSVNHMIITSIIMASLVMSTMARSLHEDDVVVQGENIPGCNPPIRAGSYRQLCMLR